MVLRVLGWILLSVWACGGAMAADFRVVHRPCDEPCTVAKYVGIMEMSGPITPGDAKKFATMLDKEGGIIGALTLRSPGGDVAEAMQIGRTVRKRLLRTNAPGEDVHGRRSCYIGGSVQPSSECVCLSSCFLVYAAGIHRSGHVLGLHRPRYDEAFFAKLPLEQANARYAAVIEQIRAYLVSMGVGDRYLERMLRVSSSEMQILTREEADRDLSGFTPAMAEWLKARCGEVSERERDFVIEWSYYMSLKEKPYAQLNDGQRAHVAYKSKLATPEIEKQYLTLANKEASVTTCRNGTLYRERERVRPKDEFEGFQEMLGPDGWPMIAPGQR